MAYTNRLESQIVARSVAESGRAKLYSSRAFMDSKAPRRRFVSMLDVDVEEWLCCGPVEVVEESRCSTTSWIYV